MTQNELQMQMQSRAASAPTRRWFALCEIQDGPNPLTRSEMFRMIERHPERADAYRAWLAGHPDWP